MRLEELSSVLVEQTIIDSNYLKREVIVDVYLPKDITNPSAFSLLVLNDGQNLVEMPFADMLNALLMSNQISPLLCIGVHCGNNRIDEYGTAHTLDFAGRGIKAEAYQQFLIYELLPFVHTQYAVEHFQQKAIAGFSMGGLSAFDTVWNHPDIFSVAGVFSGSLWWRIKDLHDGYQDDKHRIIHQRIRKEVYSPGKRFYFTTGSLDETADRNKNGIIDSIDDTMDLITELEGIGYKNEKDIRYINDENGRHDVATWAKALPQFLLWYAPLITERTFI